VGSLKEVLDGVVPQPVPLPQFFAIMLPQTATQEQQSITMEASLEICKGED
jgi:hypothetical protein